MTTKQVTMEVPLALQNLIKANNTLLKSYQAQLINDIQEANTQMMQMLQLDPANGWQLDMENMVYVRQVQETPAVTQVTDPDGFTVGE